MTNLRRDEVPLQCNSLRTMQGDGDTATGGRPSLRLSRFPDDAPQLEVLYSLNPNLVGLKQPVSKGGTLVGRALNSPGFCITDRSLSRRHLRVSQDEDSGRWQVLDLNSSNGTFVNCRRIQGSELKDGDIISAGKTLLLFRTSPGSDRQREALQRIAGSDISVLIEGETGAGKEVLATSIHNSSERTGDFVPVNCGALPRELLESELFGHTRASFSGAERARKGLFQTADGGTLFLDEIGELPLDVQPVLLRALQSNRVRAVGSDREVACDCRIIAATNRDLESEVAAGRFRADLFARLAQIRLSAKPLRQRRAEILPLLVEFARLESLHQIEFDAAEALLSWDWPYNVRELESLAKTFSVVAEQPEVTLDFLREHASALYARYESRMADVESHDEQLSEASQQMDELLSLLEEHQGNVSAVAKAMGKQRNQVYRWMRAHGLNAETFRRTAVSQTVVRLRPATDMPSLEARDSEMH